MSIKKMRTIGFYIPRKYILAFLFAVAPAFTVGAADATSEINGAWILDANATKEAILTTPPPPDSEKLAQWFLFISGYLAVVTYEFEGNLAKASVFRGKRVQEFELMSNDASDFKYVLKNTTTPKTISVSILNNGKIKIVPSDSPEFNFLRWKHGQLKTETATSDEVKAAISTWLVSLQAIQDALHKPFSTSIDMAPDKPSSGVQFQR